jgi:hypothetical protein
MILGNLQPPPRFGANVGVGPLSADASLAPEVQHHEHHADPGTPVVLFS